MDSPQTKSLVLLFPTSGAQNKYLQQVRDWLQDDQALQVHESESVADVGTQIAQFNQGLMIFSVRDKADLVEVVNCLATHQGLIKGRFLRVVGVTHMEHPEVIKLLMKRGVADILPTNLTSKALKHKISQSFKILERYHATHSAEIARDAVDKAAADKKGVGAPARKQASVQRVPPITIESDCWLIKKEKDVRQVQGRWLADILGPGPSVGTWDETSRSTPTAPEWVWNLRQPNPQFVSDEGNWVFKGRRPEFVWSENRWRFIGDQAELAFVKNGVVLAYRFKCIAAQNVLELAENSERAKKKLPFMIQSIEAEVRFKNEKNKPNLSSQFSLDIDDEEPETEEESRRTSLERETPDYRGGRSIALETPDHTTERPDAAPETVYEEVPVTAVALQIWVSAEQPGSRLIALSPIEMSPTELVVEVSTGLFSQGQKVSVIVDSGTGKPNSKNQFHALVTQHQVSDSEHDLLTIQIADGKVLPIDQAAEAIRARQDEIFNFLKSARGW
jgi:hypothetical protein